MTERSVINAAPARSGGFWHFLQIVIALAVLAANAYGGWISNGYMAAVNAGFLALAATWLIAKSLDAKRYGIRAVLPEKRAAFVVGRAIVIAVVGIVALGAIAVYAQLWLKGQ